jgi:signal peptidase
MTSTSHAVPAGPQGLRLAARAASSVLAVLVAMAAVLAIVIAIATHLSRDGGYTAFGHPVLTVLSGSMAPAIRTGDLVVEDPVTLAQAQNLRPGQIVSVLDVSGSHKVITHRIVAVRVVHGAVSYVTKGDANNAPDATLRQPSDVIGVFRFAIPRGGYALGALHRPLVLGLLLAAPVLWFLAGPLFSLARRMDEKDGPS